MNATTTRDLIALVGIPTMSEFVKSAQNSITIGGKAVDEGVLTREWTAANRIFSELQSTEAGFADHPDTRPLPTAMLPYAEAAMDDPALRANSRVAPPSWSLVELDRLAIFQKRVDLAYLDTLKATLPAVLNEEDIIRFAIRPAIEETSIHSARLSDRAFAFLSDSTDLRFIEAGLLDASAVSGLQSTGRPAKVIALFIGMSANYLTACRFANRLVLTNGTHRACALRQRGITHAPCLVYHLDREEDLDMTKLRGEDRKLLVSASRPPLFKDYFDPRLSSTLCVHYRRKLLSVEFSVRLSDI